MTAAEKRKRDVEICRLLQGGSGATEIAELYGIHRMTVYYIGKRMGWTPRSYSHPDAAAIETRDRSIRTSVARGVPMAQVALKHGLSRQRVFQIVQRRTL